jgi:hypothetical protein
MRKCVSEGIRRIIADPLIMYYHMNTAGLLYTTRMFLPPPKQFPPVVEEGNPAQGWSSDLHRDI